MCAGPFGLDLLQIGDKLSRKYETIVEKLPVFRPGFARISLPYHASEAEINFAIAAVEIVATIGWKLLPFYEIENGNFRFRMDKERKKIKLVRICVF